MFFCLLIKIKLIPVQIKNKKIITLRKIIEMGIHIYIVSVYEAFGLLNTGCPILLKEEEQAHIRVQEY